MTDSYTKTPLEMLYQWEQECPDKVYLRQPVNGVWQEYTWLEVADQVRRMAAAIKAMNFEPGSCIAITGRNTAHWIMADMAICMAGHITVGLYPKQATNQVDYILNHCSAKLVFMGPMEDPQSIEDGIPAGVPRVRFPYDGVNPCDHEWDDLIKANAPLQENTIPDDDAIWTLIYTSGTTGNPKGVAITFKNIKFVGYGLMNVIPPKSQERLFSYLPLAHIFERDVVETFSLYCCAEVSFLESLDRFAQQLPEVAPTRFFAVPAVWTRFQMGILGKMPQKKLSRLTGIPILGGIIKKKIRTGLGLQNAELCVTGAAPIPTATLEWFQKYIGITLLQGWAMSENTAYASINLPHANRFGSVGQPLPNGEVKVAEDGELLTRSKGTMKGYYLQPEKTAETIDEDGWLHTGDRGKIDDDGFIFITGRVKEIFKTLKGKYVAPAPIEGELARNAHIEQICMMGAGMAQPVVLVVLSEAAADVSKEELTRELEDGLNALNKTLEPHERISNIIVCAEPWSIDNGLLTPTMKTKRHSVEKKYAALVEQHAGSDNKVIWE